MYPNAPEAERSTQQQIAGGGTSAPNIKPFVSSTLTAPSAKEAVALNTNALVGQTLSKYSGYDNPVDMISDMVAWAKATKGANRQTVLDALALLGSSKGWSATEVTVAKNMVPMFAEGGIVTKPTLALIGERGPEMVVPLNNTAAGDMRQDITVYTTISIANVSSNMDLKQVTEAVSQGISSALKRRR
jgi:hypothetical protein